MLMHSIQAKHMSHMLHAFPNTNASMSCTSSRQRPFAMHTHLFLMRSTVRASHE